MSNWQTCAAHSLWCVGPRTLNLENITWFDVVNQTKVKPLIKGKLKFP